MDLEEGISLLDRQSTEDAVPMREKVCRAFFMAVSFIGIVIGISSLFYFMHINNDPTAPLSWQGIGALFVSVLSVTTFFILVDNSCRSSNRRRRQGRTFAAVPIPIATMDELKNVIRRSQSDKTLTAAVERDNLTRSLPPYILLSTEQMSSAASSMGLYLSAESQQADVKEASTETVKPLTETVKPVTVAPVQTPIITISEVSSLPRESDAASTETSAAKAPESATNASSTATDEEGVRKRKITPPEEQKYEPVPEQTS